VIYNSKGGEAKHPVTGAVVKPKFLGGAEPLISSPGDDRRAVLAKWLASPEEPLLCPQSGEHDLAHFFGVGIMIRWMTCGSAIPASNLELSNALGKSSRSKL